jgi:hypothetical protein
MRLFQHEATMDGRCVRPVISSEANMADIDRYRDINAIDLV